MGNKTRERKRQKTKNATDESSRADAMLLEDDSLKGQEELQLETLLFGKPSRQAVQEAAADTQTTNELEHLMDADVCILPLSV
jgi:hypothetical protein